MQLLRDFEGRSIRLTEERWAHISEHPEMAEMKPALEQALMAPETVVQSAGDPEARLYYRFFPQTRVGGKYLCVVVKLGDEDAFVVTAYLTDQVKKGKVLWPQEQ